MGDGSFGAWKDVPDSDADTVRHRVEGLANGEAHSFVVRAINPIDLGPASVAATVTRTRPLPAAPTGLVAAPGDGKVTLTWTAPAGDIVKYQVRRSADGGASWSPDWTDTGTTPPDAVTHALDRAEETAPRSPSRSAR